MDAFEKLAKLAGASVESVGEGLPRTRAEALALGVTKYFTGRPCSHGHVAEQLASAGNCTECQRQRNTSPERKEYNRQYSRQRMASPEYKERERQRMASPEYKEYRRQYDCQYAARPESLERKRKYNATPESKLAKRKFRESPAGKMYYCQLALSKAEDEILFAINQAERSACLGCVANDIIPQCPEPQRSQLQALVDRIKADPQAGKAVIGLLRTMRELRKTELAEMQAGACVEGASSS